MNEFALRAELDKAVARVRRLRKQMREVKRKAHGEPKRRKGLGVRIGDRDEAEKLRRGYVEAGSFVRRDGSEKLVGCDWAERKAQLWQRSGGLCEHATLIAIGEFKRCLRLGDDPHHKIKRSTRRDDRLSNLINLCREHHQELDPRRTRFGEQQKSVGG